MRIGGSCITLSDLRLMLVGGFPQFLYPDAGLGGNLWSTQELVHSAVCTGQFKPCLCVVWHDGAGNYLPATDRVHLVWLRLELQV